MAFSRVASTIMPRSARPRPARVSRETAPVVEVQPGGLHHVEEVVVVEGGARGRAAPRWITAPTSETATPAAIQPAPGRPRRARQAARTSSPRSVPA